ncbi:hypothetical protein SAMN05660443_0569 [Marinospirillum celere]|uniref:Oxidative stress defense protein n=1 Tax=Marinospirillum celere TaxID=1122252 RepID=A0A1I1EF79_9GAMM|nr:SIMPL domain-containing protein [Marinospirillum celere]SFB85765.1 hypothetical protein SAMN05660443_0569 [Marinospirillum celere]
MKNYLAFFGGLLLTLGLATSATAGNWAPQAHLKTQGEAKITLQADRIDIHANFSSEHQDSRLALQELESRFGNLLRNLRRQLPDEARLEAGQVRVHPKQQRRDESWQIVGYTATRDLKILDLPVEMAGEWIEKISQGEPTQLGPLHYHSTETASQRNPALQAAIEDAQAKAEIMASTLGQTLGKALQVEEVSGPGIQPRSAVMSATSARESAPVMEPGLVEISAQVRVVFELLD